MNRLSSSWNWPGLLLVTSLTLFVPDAARAGENTSSETSPSVDRTPEPDPIVERFYSVLQKKPRRGTAFDRVWASYVDQGRMPELIDRCRKDTESAPNDAGAWIVLGLMESRRGEDDAAVEAFEKAESLDPNNPLPPYYRGMTLMVVGRLPEAAGAFEAAAEKKPGRRDFLHVLQLLGRTYERTGATEKAKAVWSRVEKAFPGDLDILEQIAQALEEEERLDDALARYESLLKKATDDYDQVRFALCAADLKVRLGRKSEARGDFEKLLDGLAPKTWLFTAVRDRIELIFTREADQVGLAKYYENWLEKHPRDLDAVRRFAGTLVRLGRTDEARKQLESAVEKAPSDVELRQSLIDLLIATNKYADARAQYAELHEIDPGNPDIIRDWGLVVLKDKTLSEEARRTKAAEVWEMLLEKRGDDPQSIVLVADLLADAKMADRAETLYNRAVKAAPAEPRYREYLGFFYHSRKDKEKAIATLKGIAEGDRRSADTLSQLADVLSSLGYVEESLAPAKEAAEAEPDVFRFVHGYVRLLQKAEKADDAGVWLRKAQQLAETDDEREAVLKSEIELLTLGGKLKETTEAFQAELGEDSKKVTALDWWRLARLYQAVGNREKTGETIEKAVAADPESLLIATAAARIHERIGKLKQAAEACERLAAVDPTGRTDHLKHLVRIQMRLGKTEEALKTAGQVMAVASGNTDNCRFYASVAKQLGKTDLAVGALRRAVQVDPTDNGLLSALADVLADSGKVDQALEIEWRVLDRTKDLRGKLSVVSRLSEFYLRQGNHGELVKRFKQLSQNPDRRRESAYCSAQAYLAVRDFQSARKSLEALMGETEAEDDTMLLDQLSRIAEAEGDLPAAIRFQEMLYEKTDAAHDRDRLASLYFAGGKEEKGEKLVTRRILESDKPDVQARAVCSLLRAERYDAALEIIERLRKDRPDDWVLLYHEGEALSRLKRFDEAVNRFETLRGLDLADDTAASPAKKKLPTGRASVILARQASVMALPFYKWASSARTVRQTILRNQPNSPYGAPVPAAAYSSGRGKPQWTPTEYGEAWAASWMWEALGADEEGKKKEFLAKVEKGLPVDSEDVEVLKRRLRLEMSLNERFGQPGPGQENLTKVIKRLADTGDADWKLCYLMFQSQKIQIWVMSQTRPDVHFSPNQVIVEPKKEEILEMAAIVKDSLDSHPDLIVHSLGMLSRAMEMKGLDKESDELRNHFRELILADNAQRFPGAVLAQFLTKNEDVEIAFELAEKRLEAGEPDKAKNLLSSLLQYRIQQTVPNHIQLPSPSGGGIGAYGTATISVGTAYPSSPARGGPANSETEEERKKKQKAKLTALEPTVRMLLEKIIECEALIAASGKGTAGVALPVSGGSSRAVGIFQSMSRQNVPLNHYLSQMVRSAVGYQDIQFYQQLSRYFYAVETFDEKSRARIVKPGKTPPGVERLIGLLEKELTERTDEKELAAIRRGLLCVYGATGAGKKTQSLIDSLLKDRKPSFEVAVMQAALKARERDFEGAAATLDAFKTTKIGDTRDRDRIIIQLYNESGRKESLKERASQALGRQLSGRLSDREMHELIGMLHALGREKEAEQMTNRLLAQATDQNILRELMQQSTSRGDKDTAAKLALRVLRQTRKSGFASTASGNYQDYIRREAMQALKNAGRLKELVEPLEEQFKHAPGSVDLMKQLIELYIQLDRRADAKRLCEKLEKTVPEGDAGNCRMLGTIYTSLGEKEKGYKWMTKAVAKKPDLLMQDFHTFDRAARENGQMATLIEMLLTVDDKTLARHYYNFNHRFDEWLREKKTHDAAMKLFKKLWEAEEMDRTQLISGIRLRTPEASKELYPYFREAVVEYMELPKKPEEKEEGKLLRRQAAATVSRSGRNPHSVYSWSSDGVHSTSVGLLAVVEAKKGLEEFQKEIEGLLAELEKAADGKDEKKDAPPIPEPLLISKINTARILLAMVEARRGDAEAAKKRARALLDDEAAAELLKDSAMVLAQELAKHDACADEAIELYLQSLGNQTFVHNPHMTHYVTKPLGELYQKTGQGEKVVELVVPQIEESIGALAMSGGRSNFQVGNRYYHVHSIASQIQTQLTQLSESGFRTKALAIVECDIFSQPWFKQMRSAPDGELRYPVRELTRVRDRIHESVTIDEIVANIDVAVPPPASAKEGEKEKGKETGPRLIGAIMSTKMKSDDSIDGIGSKLQEAFRRLRKADPEKLAEIRTRVGRLVEKAPDDPRCLAVSALGELVWGDEASRRAAVRRCAKWVASQEPRKEDDKRDSSLFAQEKLAWWLVAKQAMSDKELAEECKTLTVHAARFAPAESSSHRAAAPSWHQRLLSSIKKYADPDVTRQVSRSAYADRCEAVLFCDNGRISGNLDQTIDKALHTLVSAIETEQSDSALAAIKKVYAGGWPSPREGALSDRGKTELLRATRIISEELRHAKGVNAAHVYEAFAEIVLPKKAPKRVFLAEHNYVACRASMHWSPACAMAEWAVKAKRVDDLRSRLEKCRTAGADPFAVDVVEMVVALESGDTERVKRFEQSFSERIEKDKAPEVAAAALVALSPALEDRDKRPAIRKLLDSALDRCNESAFPKFLYDVFRDEIPLSMDSGDFMRAARLMGYYRTMYRDAYHEQHQSDAFRFETDNRLWAAGLEATKKDNLPLAIAVLRYFASCKNDSFRYRDIEPAAKPLLAKLEALNEAKRKELLAGFDIAAALAENEKAAKLADNLANMPGRVEPEYAAAKEKEAALPPLPEGKTVYEADFDEAVGPEWSIRRRDRTPKGKHVFLGEFGDETLTLSLSKLPAHRLLRIRFELITAQGWDGNKGDYANFGPDIWSLSLDGGPRLIYATFACFRNDPWDSKQTYPDDFPFEREELMPAVGRSKLTAPVEGTYLEQRTDLPNHTGHTGAKEHKTLGYDRSSIYTVDVIVPHEGAAAVLRFVPDLRDGCYRGGHMIHHIGENWALDNVRVDAVPDFVKLDAKQIDECIAALAGSNPMLANAALWRLVAAGEAAVEPLRKEFKPKNTTSVEQQRIRRALRILGADKKPNITSNK